MRGFTLITKGGQANHKSANSWAHSTIGKSANFLGVPVRKSQIRKFAGKKAVLLIKIRIGLPLILLLTT